MPSESDTSLVLLLRERKPDIRRLVSAGIQAAGFVMVIWVTSQ